MQALEPLKSAEAQSFVIVVLAVAGFFVPGILIPKFAMQIYHICRMLGRDDDFLMLNFKPGGKERPGKKSVGVSEKDRLPGFRGACAVSRIKTLHWSAGEP